MSCAKRKAAKQTGLVSKCGRHDNVVRHCPENSRCRATCVCCWTRSINPGVPSRRRPISSAPVP